LHIPASSFSYVFHHTYGIDYPHEICYANSVGVSNSFANTLRISNVNSYLSDAYTHELSIIRCYTFEYPNNIGHFINHTDWNTFYDTFCC
jgi:hypothetical protein